MCGARAERAQGGTEIASGAYGQLAEVGLRDDEYVGDLHDAGLQELQGVAAAWLHDHGDGVGHVDDLRLGLADADGLDHHHVERRGQRLGRRASRPGQSSQTLSGSGRADEDTSVGGVELDPRSVSQERPAGATRARVDGQHRHRAGGWASIPPGVQQRREQRRLAGARRTGDSDHVPGRLASEGLGRDFAQQRRGLLTILGRGALQQVQGGGAALRSRSRRRAPRAAPSSLTPRALCRSGRSRCRCCWRWWRHCRCPPAPRCRA